MLRSLSFKSNSSSSTIPIKYYSSIAKAYLFLLNWKNDINYTLNDNVFVCWKILQRYHIHNNQKEILTHLHIFIFKNFIIMNKVPGWLFKKFVTSNILSSQISKIRLWFWAYYRTSSSYLKSSLLFFSSMIGILNYFSLVIFLEL